MQEVEEVVGMDTFPNLTTVANNFLLLRSTLYL